MPDMSTMLNVSYEANDQALGHPELKKYLFGSNIKNHFDVVLVFGVMAEPGFYLGHRFDAATVNYASAQSSIPSMEHDIGNPHHPAYMVVPFLDYKHPMTFLQRVVNTVASMAVEAFRYKINYLKEVKLPH